MLKFGFLVSDLAILYLNRLRLFYTLAEILPR
jgi:hypothetical protein